MNFTNIFIMMSNSRIFYPLQSKQHFIRFYCISVGLSVVSILIQYSSAYVSDELDFKNITETDGIETQQVQVAEANETMYPLRLTDGLYGIGAWSERIEEEVIFIGYEDDETFSFTSWIALSGSVGCNQTDYDYVEKLKRSDADSFIGMYFISFQGFIWNHSP